MELTAAHILMAKQAGACSVDYEPGDRILSVSFFDLVWCESVLPRIAKKLATEIVSKFDTPMIGSPALSLLADSGSVVGSGYVNGFLYWYGPRSGYGSIYGDGSGYGNGYGSGSVGGHGSGEGFGYDG